MIDSCGEKREEAVTGHRRGSGETQEREEHGQKILMTFEGLLIILKTSLLSPVRILGIPPLALLALWNKLK